jgi:hypothetical protein
MLLICCINDATTSLLESLRRVRRNYLVVSEEDILVSNNIGSIILVFTLTEPEVTNCFIIA